MKSGHVRTSWICNDWTAGLTAVLESTDDGANYLYMLNMPTVTLECVC